MLFPLNLSLFYLSSSPVASSWIRKSIYSKLSKVFPSSPSQIRQHHFRILLPNRRGRTIECTRKGRAFSNGSIQKNVCGRVLYLGFDYANTTITPPHSSSVWVLSVSATSSTPCLQRQTVTKRVSCWKILN